jgi:hypothetical protein
LTGSPPRDSGTRTRDQAVDRRQDAALVIAVEVNFYFGTIGQAPAVVFVQLVQNTGVPAIAPLIALQAGNFVAVFRQASRLFTGVTLNFCIGVDGIKAQTEAPAVVQTISTAQVQV